MMAASHALRAVAAVLLGLGLLLSVPVRGGETEGPTALVLLADSSTRDTYSKFFAQLEAVGLELDFQVAGDPGLLLQKWDTWLYDSLIVFAPKAEDLGGALDSKQVLEFIDEGGNVLLAVDEHVSASLRDIAAQSGIDLALPKEKVLDHFNLRDTSDHTVIVTDDVATAAGIFGSEGVQAPILFSGIGASLSFESELAFSALRPSATAYSASSKTTSEKSQSVLAGKHISLVSLMQARNNARVAVLGSMEMCSDAFFTSAVEFKGKKYPKSGNEAFCTGVSRWATRQRGVLKVDQFLHNTQGSGATVNSSLYTIKDDVELTMRVTQLVDGKWVPYTCEDLQFDFTMLHPYVRNTMKHDDKGIFSAAFKVPDVYGIFKFVVNHYRIGYSYIDISEQVSVRPFKHNQFERFIVAAYPYYSSVFSMMAGFFVFGVLFLHAK